jgi:hypothetical protein
MTQGHWSAIDLLGPLKSKAPLVIQANAVRVTGDQTWLITAEPVDLVAKVEVLRIRAAIISESKVNPRAPLSNWQGVGELLAAFLGGHRRLAIATRRYESPDWRSLGIGDVLVDDSIILRDSSGQQAMIVVDNEQPGALLIVRGSSLNDINGAIDRLRVL